jgi:L,D-peptidoglycan transpeptidase YkuD (ErfK/YbiS/YcfS/YnhG family)
MKTMLLKRLRVRARPGQKTKGWMVAGNIALPVALGRGGIKANKREGDGSTPRGTFLLRRLWWRADRMPRPRTGLPVRRIKPQDGWCEDPRDRHYNQPVTVPKGSTADRLWRMDALYDLIVEISHNTRPRVAGRGSAVFIHIARTKFAPTAGCVALEAVALQRLVRKLGPYTRIDIS